MTQNKTQIDFCPYTSKCDCNHQLRINDVDLLYEGLPIIRSTDDHICDLDIYHERKKLCPMLDGPTQ